MVRTGGEAPSWVGVVTARWEGRGCRRGPCWALGKAILQPLGLGQGRAEGPVEQDRPAPLRQKQGAGTKERPQPSLPSWPEPRQPSSAPSCKGRASSTLPGGVSAPSMPEELLGVHPPQAARTAGGLPVPGHVAVSGRTRVWPGPGCADLESLLLAAGQVCRDDRTGGKKLGCAGNKQPCHGPLATPGWTCV